MKVGIFKCGNIGTAPLLELLLDELADRTDISVQSVTTGAKMLPQEVEEALPKIFDFNPDFLIFISPNPAVKGPARAREILLEKGMPSIFISDSPGKRLKEEFEKAGFGYIIVMGDPMIGARKEFLDPTEMAIFNANVIKVLAVTGVYRIVQQEIDRVISFYKEGLTPEFPRLILDTDVIMTRSDFKNPYAKAKAIAAYELMKKVAEINVKACFMEQNKEKYIPLVASSHEIVQIAAKLSEEAREIEKYSDTLTRRPHAKDGTLKIKEKLMEKPLTDDEIYKNWFKAISKNSQEN
ncbi:F420-dependent methylenetetrahydromethanopterin dehydrogenase [Candidatus Bathyarchaeota archaeon]|nr:F420-dependent methylenetetrahydromethanopterin dehydrogenase [Candidatus Bathyarchaeota archaeon]